MERFLEEFSSILEKNLHSDKTFAELCGIIGVDAAKFDRYLHKIFGTCGEDIVKAYRTKTPLDML